MAEATASHTGVLEIWGVVAAGAAPRRLRVVACRSRAGRSRRAEVIGAREPLVQL
jgi:hypothetical protein